MNFWVCAIHYIGILKKHIFAIEMQQENKQRTNLLLLEKKKFTLQKYFGAMKS